MAYPLVMKILAAAIVTVSIAVSNATWGQTPSVPRVIEIWHGGTQRVGHLGDSQNDFNLMGHIAEWKELDGLHYGINGKAVTPLAFRAYRRLVNDGDFNADIPIGALRMGDNTILIQATFRDGARIEKRVQLIREAGMTQNLPLRIRWSEVKHLTDAGQAVDGKWEIGPQGLRTAEVGYDRVFLIGNRDWRDYEVQTNVTIHRVMPKTTLLSGGNGIGLILRFTGHVTGGPRYFGSGQPKWGYQPFGAIGWIRWDRGEGEKRSFAQYYPGDNDRGENEMPYPVQEGETYGMRFSCKSMADSSSDDGVTLYQYRVWNIRDPEPDAWSWERTQKSRNALRAGGVAFVAHHIDASFGDVLVQAK